MEKQFIPQISKTFNLELLNHLDAIETLSTLLDSLLDQAKQNVKESLEDFVSDKVRCLGQAIGGYFKCLNVLGVKTRADFESKWTACYQNKNVRETVENLLEVEECWDEFLRNVDRELDKAVETSWQPVSVGSSAPIDMPIFNVDTESSTTLCDLSSNNLLLNAKQEFANTKTEVAVVSFGSKEKAVAWKNDTKCEFPVLVDADRHLYVALGLKRSVSKVWRISSLVYYAEQKLAGRKLLAMLDEDDPLQLGGDFIINSTGKLVFIYQSKTSTDRPSVDSLLNFLRSNSDLA